VIGRLERLHDRANRLLAQPSLERPYAVGAAVVRGWIAGDELIKRGVLDKPTHRGRAQRREGALVG
jgi:hypothetical protein